MPRRGTVAEFVESARYADDDGVLAAWLTERSLDWEHLAGVALASIRTIATYSAELAEHADDQDTLHVRLEAAFLAGVNAVLLLDRAQADAS